MEPVDLQASAAVLLALAAGAVCYVVRVASVGRTHYPRVDAAGGSRLLSKGLLEMGYSWLQPAGRFCVRHGVAPDALTGASLLLAGLAGVALALGHFGVAALLAAVSALGDALDGLVARAAGRAGPRGALFDASADRYGEFFFLAGLVLHWSPSRTLLLLPLAALLGSYMVSYGSAKAEGLRVPVPGGSMRRAERAVWLCGGALLTPVWAFALGNARGGAALVSQPLLGEAPLLVAVALVAVVSNFSAVLRLQEVGRAAAAGATTLPVPAAAGLAAAAVLVAPLLVAPALAATGTQAGEQRSQVRGRGEPEGAVARGRAAAKDSTP